MNQVLKSKLGLRAFQVLIDVLLYSTHIGLYRGAIFFLGMILVSKSVQHIDTSLNSILEGLMKALSANHEFVTTEIIRTLKLLVKYYGHEMRTEWDSVFDMLLKLDGQLIKKVVSLTTEVQDIIKDIEGILK